MPDRYPCIKGGPGPKSKPFMPIAEKISNGEASKKPTVEVLQSTVEKFWGVRTDIKLIPPTPSLSSKLLFLKKAALSDVELPANVRKDLIETNVDALLVRAKKQRTKTLNLQQRTKTYQNVSIRADQAFSDPDVRIKTVNSLRSLGSAAIDTIVAFERPRVAGTIREPTLGAVMLGHSAFEHFLFSVDPDTFIDTLHKSAIQSYQEKTFAKFEDI